jgi:hypothetical protein
MRAGPLVKGPKDNHRDHGEKLEATEKRKQMLLPGLSVESKLRIVQSVAE